MLDALKFAFEILVVAALAMPWLALLHRMFPAEGSFSFRGWLDLIPKDAKSAVSITVVLAFGYLLGSAIERISRNFFNDDIWRGLPTEHLIRVETYREAYCEGHLVSELSLPYGEDSGRSNAAGMLGSSSPLGPPETPAKAETPDRSSGAPVTPGASGATGTLSTPAAEDRSRRRFGLCPSTASTVRGPQSLAPTQSSSGRVRGIITELGFQRRVEDMFRLQESALMLEGADKVARLKEYYDQIAVLRGAAFSGFLLFALSVFGLLGRWRLRWAGKRWARILLLVPACLVVLFAFESSWHHWGHIREKVYNDKAEYQAATDGTEAPVTDDSRAAAETLGRLYVDPPLAEFVVLLIGIVGFVATLRAEQATSYLRICTIAAVLTLISFGGWWWTEVMYDREVIHSQPILALGSARYVPDPGKP